MIVKILKIYGQTNTLCDVWTNILVLLEGVVIGCVDVNKEG